MSLLKFVLFLFAASSFVVAQGPNPIVRVAHGILQGSWKVSTKGRTYASFEGIPYARPPVGKYRFREPQQMKQWSGVWDATKPMPWCLQYDALGSRKIEGSENCLYVNVYTPNLNAGASLPVVVYIHGGAFMFGAGSIYDPTHMMDRDWVVVTFNYRLGPLGFLSTGDDVVPGNAGLKDQSFALQWVQNNIMMFGGNPDSVTLTGCSAGGASVHYHYLSPMSRGTFARGIAFSGSAFSSWTHAVKPAQKARTLGSIVGCPVTTSRDMVECLKYRPAEMLINAQLEMFDWRFDLFTPFVPTVEAPGSRNPFLSKYPFHAAQSGAIERVPLITSVTSEEGLYPAAVYQTDPAALRELEVQWEQLASDVFSFNDTLALELRPEAAKKIKQQYLGSKPVSQETFPGLVQALGDRLFAVDVGKLAQIHAQMSGQPTYLYRYSFRGDFSLSNLMAADDKNYGVSHADDVLHIFKYEGLESSSPEDRKITDGFLDLIYSYSTTGVPRFSASAPAWLPVQPGSPDLNYLEIASPTQLQMKTSSDFGHRAFWDSLGFVENEKYNGNIRDEL